MIKILVLLVIVLNCFVLGSSRKEEWKEVQCSDTLDVLLNGQYAGTLHSALIVNETSIQVINRLDIGTIMHESREYGFNGILRCAQQELESPSGRNFWKLYKSADTWMLSVNAGGVQQQKSIIYDGENINSILQIYNGILHSTLNVGDIWTDTSLELTSGTAVITETVCLEIPAAANHFTWIFRCRNNVNNKDELWKVDKSGKTVYREMYPFVVRKKDLSASGHKLEIANLFEAFKIPASAKASDKEQILLFMDSTIQLDSSVFSFYHHNGRAYRLKRQIDRCVEQKSVTIDSLAVFLEATPTMQINHPDIVNLSNKMKKDLKNSCEIVSSFNKSVYKMIKKRNTATFSSALETLKSGFGDCGEHAVLLAAMLRAAGIPARVVMGLVYMEPGKGYYYHAWVMAYTGEWIFADPSHNVFPAARDRVPLLIDDTGEKMLLLSKYIGRISIEYEAK